MSDIWRRIRGKPCPHHHMLVVTSVGVRRSVCESCGHISFEMEHATQPLPPNEKRSKMPRAVGF